MLFPHEPLYSLLPYVFGPLVLFTTLPLVLTNFLLGPSNMFFLFILYRKRVIVVFLLLYVITLSPLTSPSLNVSFFESLTLNPSLMSTLSSRMYAPCPHYPITFSYPRAFSLSSPSSSLPSSSNAPATIRAQCPFIA